MNKKLPPNLKSQLKRLAKKYETADFVTSDPSQILRRYSQAREQEIAAFITAQLSFGKRELFLAKVNSMFAAIDGVCVAETVGKTETARGAEQMDGVCIAETVGKTETARGARCSTTPSQWLLSGEYKKFFPKSPEKFYRFFSYADMNALCVRLATIIKGYGTLGTAVRESYEELQKKSRMTFQASKASGEFPQGGDSPLMLVTALINLFPGVKCVAQDPKGACKKLHMFLRWMVRQGSPVDLGLWDWACAKDLLIPLDVHVMQEGMRLGLLPPKCTPSAKTAIMLTQRLAQIWPDDPTKGDFALFGLGVDADN